MGYTVTLGIVGLISLVVALALTPVVIRFAVARRLFDAPDGQRRIHSVAVPRIGGVAVFAAFLIAAAVAYLARLTAPAEMHLVMSTLAGAILLFVLGVIDDVRGVSPIAKLLVQVIAAIVVIGGGLKLALLGVTANTAVGLGWIEAPLLVLWIVGATNAFNLIDGLNGLAGGIGLVAAVTATAAALLLGHTGTALAGVALVGGLLGFLRYNFPRASVFLGDSGSMPIGFLLAVLTVRAATLPNGVVLFVIPVVALFLPLMDAILAIGRRWLRNEPVSGADARHIHHRLLALGLSQPRTTVVLWCVAGAVAVLGVVVELAPPVIALGLTVGGLMGLLAFVIYGTRVLAYHEFRVASEVLRGGPARVRRVISDQIQAHDVSVLVRYAENLADVSHILDANASRFGFESMELRALGESAAHLSPIRDKLASAWRLEYPLFATGDGESGGASHSFSIWCRVNDDSRPFGAERVARVLAPVLERRIEEIRQSIQPPARMAAERLTLSLRSDRLRRRRSN